MIAQIPEAEAWLLCGGVALWTVLLATRHKQIRVVVTRAAVPTAAPSFDAVHAALPVFWYIAAQTLFHRLSDSLGSASQPAAAERDGLTPGSVAANALTQISTCLLLAWMARASGARGAAWCVGDGRWRRDLRWAATAYLLSWPVIYAAATVTEYLLMRFVPSFEPALHSALTFLHDSRGPLAAKAGAVFSAAVLAPLMEEWYFRGVLQNVVARLSGSAWAGICLSAILFGAIHGDLPQNVPALTLFGAVLGFVYYRTGSLMAAVWLHAIFNAKTLLFLAWYGPMRS